MNTIEEYGFKASDALLQVAAMSKTPVVFFKTEVPLKLFEEMQFVSWNQDAAVGCSSVLDRQASLIAL